MILGTRLLHYAVLCYSLSSTVYNVPVKYLLKENYFEDNIQKDERLFCFCFRLLFLFVCFLFEHLLLPTEHIKENFNKQKHPPLKTFMFAMLKTVFCT